MKRIFIKPAPLVIDEKAVERRVRKPTGVLLAADGEEVNLDTYWQRRLNDGDVVEAPPPSANAAQEDGSASAASTAAAAAAPSTTSTSTSSKKDK